MPTGKILIEVRLLSANDLPKAKTHSADGFTADALFQFPRDFGLGDCSSSDLKSKERTLSFKTFQLEFTKGTQRDYFLPLDRSRL
jgi:hypothetical protein